MKRFACFCLVVAALGFCCSHLRADGITITVVPWSAPNAAGSSSFAPAAANAVYAIGHDLTSFGSGVTAFNAIPNGGSLPIDHNIVTGFNSWNGVAAPNTPTYSLELGNRLHFGVRIKGNGNKISVSQMGFQLTDNGTYPDAADGNLSLPSADYKTFGAVGSYNYSDQLIGIIHNAGPYGNVYITSGPNNQLVDEIVGRGSGNAWAVYDTDLGATRQDKIDRAVRSIGSQGAFTVVGKYYLDNASGPMGSAEVHMTPVPLPSAVWGSFALLAALAAFQLLKFAKARRLAAKV